MRLLPILAAASIAALAPAQQAPAPPPGGIVSEDLLETAPLVEDAWARDEAAAAQAYADGDLTAAIAAYRDLGTRHPQVGERVRLRVTAAWLLLQQGNSDGASQLLVEALFEQPDYELQGELYSPEFVSLVQNAQRDAATQRLRLASTRLQEGVDALARGDLQRARSRLDESLELVPNQPLAVYNLALVELRSGASDAALAGFEKVLALERIAPDKVSRELKSQALNNLGALYFGREQYEDAAAAFEQAVALDDRDAGVWFNLGLCRQRLGRKLDALDAFRRAHELDRRNTEVASQLARAYSDAGSGVEAAAVLAEAVEVRSDSAPLWYQLALAQRGLGNGEGMEQSLRQALAHDAENRAGVGAQSALLLAERALAGKNYGQAFDAATAATRLAPAEPSGWAYLALAQQAQGDLAGAAASFTRASELAPQRADLAHNLGTVYLAQKRFGEAEAAFQRAVELDPTATESATALARLRLRAAVPAAGVATPAAEPPRRELGLRLRAVDYAPLGIRGLLVEAVAPESLAATSGLRQDDLILRAADRPVSEPAALQREAQQAVRAGSLKLAVLRGGKPIEISLRLQ